MRLACVFEVIEACMTQKHMPERLTLQRNDSSGARQRRRRRRRQTTCVTVKQKESYTYKRAPTTDRDKKKHRTRSRACAQTRTRRVDNAITAKSCHHLVKLVRASPSRLRDGSKNIGIKFEKLRADVRSCVRASLRAVGVRAADGCTPFG